MASVVNHPEERRVRQRWYWLRETRPRRLVLLGGCLVALFLITQLGLLSIQHPILTSDVWATHEIQEVNFPGVLTTLRLVSMPGYTPWNIIVVALGVLLAAWRLDRRTGAYLLALTAAQGLANTVIKNLVGRPRPTSDLVEVFFVSAGKSFPSGHVMFYTVFFGFLFFLYWTRIGRSIPRYLLLALFAALVLLVGPSRLYLGAHWLSDVIAAYLLGFAILLPAIELYIERIAPPTHVIADTAVAEEEVPQSA